MSSPLKRPPNTPVDFEIGEEIVARVRAGDVKAFEMVFVAYYHRLIDIAQIYVRSKDAAEEVVQDAFSRLWVRRATWVVKTSVRSYLYVMIRNAAMHVMRHDRVKKHYADGLSGTGTYGAMGTWDNRADTALIGKEFNTAASRAIEAMPPRMQRAYRLRMAHGMSLAEIAEAMGISVPAVDKLMARAQGRLNEALLPYM